MSSALAPSRSQPTASMRRRFSGVIRDPLTQVALTLALLPWLIAPGIIQPDTKSDLVIDPWRYLGRALHAWSDHSGFGELQNQAYGYLFPIGPFFGTCHSLGVPAWATQRLWWSLLLVVGCAGASLMARRMFGFGTAAATCAGVLYALSPRFLSLVSELSVETWPGMMMPWLILAVHGYLDGRVSPKVYVVRVGALCAALGGVNATASLVAVVGAGIWAMTASRRGHWTRSVGFYAVGAALGCAWWLGPLFVLGRYSYPFMDFIETSHITTAVTSTPGILRGAQDWVAYIIDADSHPVWQSGWVVAQGTASIVGGLALAGLGLFGLGQASLQRTWLATPGTRGLRALQTLLVVGLVVMGAGYVGVIDGPQAEFVRRLLDGPLAAARNVHKFDPFVRLPLALGAAWVIQRAVEKRGGLGMPRQQSRGRAVAAVAVALTFFASCQTFWQGRVADANGVHAYPASLSQVAAAIDADAKRDGGSTLVLPSARNATYEWGTSTDEPLVAFAKSPVAQRASAPLVAPGAQRLMDAVDQAVAANVDPQSLDAVASALARAGVNRVVIRSGLTTATQTTPAMSYVKALSASSAFGGHRSFGTGDTRYDLFTVQSQPPTTGHEVGVLGGPESTLSLAAAGVTPGVPYAMGKSGGWITDDVRKRVYNNGRPTSVAFGPTLPATSAEDQKLGRKDLDYAGRSASLVTQGLEGLSRVTATSSTASPFADTYLGTGSGAAAAVDASRDTAWMTSNEDDGVLSLKFTEPLASDRVVTVLAVAPAQSSPYLWSRLSANASGTANEQVNDWRTRDAAGRRYPAFTLTVPAGSRSLELGVGDKRGQPGVFGIASLEVATPSSDSFSPAQNRLGRSILKLPGRVTPSSSGVVMTQQHDIAMGHPLMTEDAGAWSRQLTVAKPGTMRLHAEGGCSADAVRVISGGARITGTGCDRQIALKPGSVDLAFASSTHRVTLTPTDSSARTALGLDGRQPTTGPFVAATTTGSNQGWASDGGGQSPLSTTVVDGWRQAYEVHSSDAAAAAAVNKQRFTPQTAHAVALGAGSLLAVICAVAAMISIIRPRRLTPASEAERLKKPGATWLSNLPGGSRPLSIALATVAVSAVFVGWAALPITGVALAFPRRLRPYVALAAAACAGPVMATLGVVDKSSLGAFFGQILGALAVTAWLLSQPFAPSGLPVAQEEPRTPTQLPQKSQPSE